MAILSVTYDLREDGKQDYTHLIAALKRFDGWCRATKSGWLIRTTAGVEAVYNYLKPHLSRADKILITPVVLSSYWSQGLSEDVRAWLRAQYDAQQMSRPRVR